MLIPLLLATNGRPVAHFLALPGRHPRWWVVAGLSLAASTFGVSLILAAIFTPPADLDGPHGLAVLGIGAIGFGLLLPVLFLQFWIRAFRLRRAAARLGMRFAPRVADEELRRYRNIPVMAFAEGWKIAACNAVDDPTQVDPVRLIDLGYQGTVGNVSQRVVQTVAVLPAARGLRFAFGRFPSGREEVYPQWAFAQGLTSRFDIDAGRYACVLLTPGGRDLDVPDDLRADLDRLGEWCIESDGETLFVFRTGQLVAPETLASFLLDVRKIGTVAERLSALAQRPPRRPLPGYDAEPVAGSESSEAYSASSRETTPSPAPRRTREEPAKRPETDVASVARRMAAEQVEFRLANQAAVQWPLPGREPAVWLCLGPAALGAGVLAFFLVVIANAKAPQPGSLEVVFALGILAMLAGVFFSLILSGIRLSAYGRAWSLAHGVGRGEFRVRPRTEALQTELSDFPLLRFGEMGYASVAHALAEGELDGRSIQVFDVGILVPSPDAYGMPGWYRSVQTVALVRDPDLSGRFHCGPLATPWDWINFSWSREQCLFSESEVFDEGGRPAALIRATRETAASGAIPPAARDLLLSRHAPIVEGCPGLLMVYHVGEKVSAAQMPEFLDLVGRAVKAFRA